MAGRTLVDQTDQLKLFFVVATDLIVKNDEIAMMFIVILSILVDTFISKISFPMQPGPEIGSISDA